VRISSSEILRYPKNTNLLDPNIYNYQLMYQLYADTQIIFSAKQLPYLDVPLVECQICLTFDIPWGKMG